jgi:hypothetical protein
MSATVADAQVRTYLDGVKAHLDDLPEDDRDELLEDLEEHLLEVAAESDGTLEQRLGPPAVYAEELRASAGLPSREQLLARRPAQRVADRLARSSLWRSAAGFAESSFGREARSFLKELAPGWWVLRGYLLVVAAAAITGGSGRDDFPIPAPVALGGPLVVAGVIFSVWLGRRTRNHRKGRVLSIVFSIAVAVAAAGALSGWDSGAYVYTVEDGSQSLPYLHHADGTLIANICPYSSDGKLLSGVLLFDQDGRGIIDTADQLSDGRPLERSTPTILNAYPRAISVIDSSGEPVQQTLPLTCPPAIGAPMNPPPSVPGVPSPIPGG